MQPLDSLSALAMGHHAKDDDLLRWTWGGFGSKSSQRVTCKAHLLRLIHRAGNRQHAKKFKPGTIELMIARDQFEDMLRRGNIMLFDVRGPAPDPAQSECPHCRYEWAKKYGHLYG